MLEGPIFDHKHASIGLLVNDLSSKVETIINKSMFASVARCTIVSTAQTLQESGNTDITNIRSAGFDFQ